MKNIEEFIRYGKSAKDIIPHKKSFFDENKALLSESIKINKMYSNQPKRVKCKNCNYSIKQKQEANFKKLHVNYFICNRCGHLNGENEDNDFFCSEVYTSNNGSDYSKLYNSESVTAYKKRTKDIYTPKALFLRDALVNIGINAEKLKYADIGAGSGYFVSALRNAGLVNTVGYEVSEFQVTFGNSMIGQPLLNKIEISDTIKLVETMDAEVISMIGVLEHVQYPREILKALESNKNLKYFYISVPLFSLGVFFEMIFPNVMNRQLSGAHTHLYTESSLNYMANEFNLTRIASWWFGTDIMDLFRSVSVSLDQNNFEPKISLIWDELFGSIIDDLQLGIDKKNMSSEVHMLFKLNR
jgi:2-polyprenyl-3-methyl-5-hydroxy-6-metoxy-1,4-benzoquinol methylase